MTQKLISSALKHHKSSLKKHSLSKDARKTKKDEALRHKNVNYDTDSDNEAPISSNAPPSSSTFTETTTKQLLAASKQSKKQKQIRDSQDNERLKPIYRGAWSDDEDSSDDESNKNEKQVPQKANGAPKQQKTAESSEDENEDSDSSDDAPQKHQNGAAQDSESDDSSESDDDEDSNAVSIQKWNKRDLHASSKRDAAANRETTFEDKQQELQEANVLQKRRAERLKRVVEATINEEYASESEDSGSDSDDEQTNDELEQELVAELKEKLAVVQNQLQPLLRKVRDEGYATDEGLSYLETKYHLLLSYCMNIVFFLTLKASGRSVEDHPVIEYLVEQRKLLEKIKPIDDRMKYQLQKLVQIATTTETVVDSVPQNGADEDAMEGESSSEDDNEGSDSEADATAKPNLNDFMDDDDSSVDDSSDEEEAAVVRASMRKKAKENGEETYVAPKLMAVASNVDKREKKLSNYEKKKEQLKQRLADSGILQDIMEDFGDAPVTRESVGSMKLTGSKAVRFARELEEYEMKNMKRVQLTKAQKKLLREAEKDSGNFDDELKHLDAFSDFVAHEAKAKEVEDEKVTLLEYLGNEEEARRFLNAQNNNKEENSRKRKRIQEPTVEPDSDESDIVEDIGPRGKKMRRLTEEKKLRGDVEEVGRRAATKKELVNKGVRVNKRTDQKNSRVKFKKRYDAKTAKQRNMVAQMEKLRGGSGALPSVNANVVRSRKAK